jgi:hypothetical protein
VQPICTFCCACAVLAIMVAKSAATIVLTFMTFLPARSLDTGCSIIDIFLDHIFSSGASRADKTTTNGTKRERRR